MERADLEVRISRAIKIADEAVLQFKRMAAKRDSANREVIYRQKQADFLLASITHLIAMLAIARGDIDTLTKRLEAIAEKGICYRGVFNLSEDYARGDLVTHGGSIFHAVKDTRGIAPAHEGERGSDYPWQLACRRGRDGKLR